MPFPRMLRVLQKFDAPRIDDVPAEVERQLAALDLGQIVQPGQTVAITVGSRGIAKIAQIIKASVDHFKGLGSVPFIVPAMGSHGGGTAEGQREIVEGYGITESYVGAEIRSSMETVIVAQTPNGVPVHFDKHAYGADHVFVCGRVKPHTGLTGDIESGLHKMLLIGLGKHAGAEIYHKAFLDYSFTEIIRSVASVVLEKCKIVAGLAIVENSYDETGLLEAVRPADFFEREKALLVIARRWLPKLPFKNVDVLIVDEIGKNIAGTGLDTNVIGRKYGIFQPTEKDEVACKRLFIRGLTDATHGNGCGLGYADVTNQRTIDAVDRRKTAINALTANRPFNAALPIAFETDRECVAALLDTIGLIEPQDARVVQITNTLHLKEVLISEAYLPEIETRDDLEILAGPHDMPFDANGNLQSVAARGF